MRAPTAGQLFTSPIEKQIQVGFGLAALIVIIVGLISYLNIRSSIDTNALVAHTREVIQALEDTQISLLDAETNVRGFYITADEDYVPPYQAAASMIPQHLAQLRSLIADNPVQVGNLDQLEPLVTTRLQQLQTAIDTRSTATLVDAQAQTTPGSGKATMDDIRGIVDGMVNQENGLLAPRVDAAAASAQGTLITLLVLTILTILILAAVYVLFQRDITGRKRVEGTLDTERNVLRTLVDALPDLIFIKKPDGAFLLNNRAYAASVGLPGPEALLGKTDFDIFPRELAEQYRLAEIDLLNAPVPLINHEEPLVKPDGSRHYFLTTKIPLRGPDGEVDRIVGISHDITDRKHYEENIQALNLTLERRSNQVEAVNKELEAFSYTISHDLRAPLRAIRGFSQIVLGDYAEQLPADGKRYLDLIDDNARQMADLIDDLLNFSRLGRHPIVKETVDMTDLARQTWAEVSAEHPDRTVEFKLAEMKTCKADRSLLHQVYANLLANALKFTGKRQEACIEVGAKPGTDDTVYFVRDNGAGFDMQYYDKLFGVFQRLHRAEDYEGTGVGLAIVQRIVRRHGGRVWAEGKVDAGATFYFTLTGKTDETESSASSAQASTVSSHFQASFDRVD